MPLTSLFGSTKHINPDSVSQSAGTITVVINGQSLQIAVGSPTANTLYFVYLLNGALVQSTTVPSAYRAANVGALLVTAYYSNGATTPAFGSFVTIEGAPRTSAPITAQLTATNLSGFTVAPVASWSRNGNEFDMQFGFTKDGSAGSGGTLLLSFPTNIVANSSAGAATAGSNAIRGAASTYAITLSGLYDRMVGVIVSSDTAINFIKASSGTGINGSDVQSAGGMNGHIYGVPVTAWSSTPLKDL